MPVIQQNSSFPRKPSIFLPSPYGSGGEANILDDELREIENDEQKRVYDRTPRPVDTEISASSIIDEIKTIASDCSVKNWDGYDAAPIKGESVKAAIKFLNDIQISPPIPDVVPEPDGDLGLEWEIDSENWLIISFHGTSVIHFAAKFGESRFEGKESDADQKRKITLGFLERITVKYNQIMT